jgi:hypothetical protein
VGLHGTGPCTNTNSCEANRKKETMKAIKGKEGDVK